MSEENWVRNKLCKDELSCHLRVMIYCCHHIIHEKLLWSILHSTLEADFMFLIGYSELSCAIQRKSFYRNNTKWTAHNFGIPWFTFCMQSKAVLLQAWRGQWESGRLRPRIFLTFGTRRLQVVSLTHRPALLPGIFLVLIFRGWVDPRAHGSVVSLGKNPQWQHWGSIPRPPD
jgi:hypothetical protein